MANIVTTTIQHLVSCEHYKNEDGSLTPVLNDISFDIHSNEILGIGASKSDELDAIIEIIGNMRPYYSGLVQISGKDLDLRKRIISDDVFYADSHHMIFGQMNVLEQLMYIKTIQADKAILNIKKRKKELLAKSFKSTSEVKKEIREIIEGLDNEINKIKAIPAQQVQKETLDLIKELRLDDYVVSPINSLKESTQMVITILVACLSDSERIVINTEGYIFSYDDCRHISVIFEYFKNHGKTIILGSNEPKLIGIACSRVILIDKGQLLIDSEVNELYKTYDKIVCKVKSDNNKLLKSLIDEQMPRARGTIEGFLIIFRDCKDEDVLNKQLLGIAKANNIRLDYIKFNQGRVENAFNELKASFHDIHK